jgi:hypothetical protein
MVEKKGGEPRYVPVPPETSGWGEVRQSFVATSRMKLPTVEGGRTVWKEVNVTVGFDPDTGEPIILPGGQSEGVRWYDLRGALPDDQVEQVEDALRKVADRRRTGYKP